MSDESAFLKLHESYRARHNEFVFEMVSALFKEAEKNHGRNEAFELALLGASQITLETLRLLSTLGHPGSLNKSEHVNKFATLVHKMVDEYRAEALERIRRETDKSLN